MTMHDKLEKFVENYARMLAGNIPTVRFEHIFPYIDFSCVRYIASFRSPDYTETRVVCDWRVDIYECHVHLQGRFIPDMEAHNAEVIHRAVYSYASNYLATRYEYLPYVTTICRRLDDGVHIFERNMVTLFPEFLKELDLQHKTIQPYKRDTFDLHRVRASKEYEKLHTMLLNLKLADAFCNMTLGRLVVPLIVEI